MVEPEEQGLVEQLIPFAAVERLADAVLLGLAGRDEVPEHLDEPPGGEVSGGDHVGREEEAVARERRQEGQDAFDPTAAYRRELRALLRQERRARWAALRRRG